MTRAYYIPRTIHKWWNDYRRSILDRAEQIHGHLAKMIDGRTQPMDMSDEAVKRAIEYTGMMVKHYLQKSGAIS